MPDIKQYTGREQAFVKHAIIEKYLVPFTFKIGSHWDQIAYLDAFAGPWKNVSEDLSDTSFCIALKQLKKGVNGLEERSKRRVGVRAYLIEKNGDAFEKLARFGTEQRAHGFEVTCLHGSFEDKLSEIRSQMQKDGGLKTFLFALIDPNGWTGLSMEKISPLLRQRSAEVLVNVMTSHINRFANVDNRQLSYEQFFGRAGVREIIADTPYKERADAVVREYCRSLRKFCGFDHVSSAVVLEPDKKGVRYFMVFGTNSPMGIKVFKEAESHAASLQDQIKYEKEMGNQMPLFAESDTPPVSAPLREKYREIAFNRVLEIFRDQSSAPYENVFCKAMAMPLVTEEELLGFIDTNPNLKLELEGSRRTRPSIDSKKRRDRVMWVGAR